MCSEKVKNLDVTVKQNSTVLHSIPLLISNISVAINHVFYLSVLLSQLSHGQFSAHLSTVKFGHKPPTHSSQLLMTLMVRLH